MTQREASLITEMERALGHALGAPVRVTTEDRLRGAMIEACSWLRLNAPGRALEVLEASLQHEIAVIARCEITAMNENAVKIVFPPEWTLGQCEEWLKARGLKISEHEFCHLSKESFTVYVS